MAGDVFDDDPPVSEQHARARKIKRQLAQGPLVKAAGARNQVEGELIQSLLLEHGVPSLLRRTAGFDVPDFLAAGPRDVMVPQSGLETAREVLLQSPDLVQTLPGGAGLGAAPRGGPVNPLALALALGAGLLVLLVIVVVAMAVS
ncbi:MAG TPA: hypothetical protein VFR97_01735 [Capillimicrobium sp.]|nr:hypothetical protein [Capillimicrobium sp.]